MELAIVIGFAAVGYGVYLYFKNKNRKEPDVKYGTKPPVRPDKPKNDLLD